ncbi:MAG: cob(I)yrinic acid a,c-diamide adenosyltransferase [Deltaproteobacteria bacterium]|nr:cob(I)yrinic acid a,c-diamide adenosyltransferase [Deltaproteobacteria bacterium]MBW2136136.1 cob(I)yrinic acid a,c-diamide adenosyltransferase [Deltaproteobacteria bacterium]
MHKGLVIVYTGRGKGKTSAALGMGMRGAGHGLKTLMIQFIKGSWHYGELDAVKKLHPYFQIKPMGKGFIHLERKAPSPEDSKAVREAWDFFLQNLHSGQFHMIILDEINYALDFNLIALEEVMEAVRSKPQELHLVLTGRNAHPQIIDLADLVTEMKEVKHPYRNGIKAQKGIEY